MGSGLRRQWLSACLCATLLLSGAAAVAAVRNGATTVPTSTGGSVLAPDVAYDPTTNTYLVVTGRGRAQGAWVSPSSAVASGTFNLTGSTAYQQSPGVACGDAGVCLVAWHEGGSGTTPMARVLSKAGGMLSAPVPIGPRGSNWVMSPGVAYSPTAHVFLVTWMGDYLAATNKDNILYAILNQSGQVLFSGHMTTGNGYERSPSVGFNPATGQFVVVYCGVVESGAYAFVKAQRVGAGGALVGSPILIDQAGGTFIARADYNTQAQAMLVSWSRGGTKIYGRQFNNDATFGPLLILSANYGAYDALGSAYNPNTKSFLLVTHGPTVEDVGIEVSSANTTMNAFTLTNDGGTGNFNPRVASSTAGTGWMAATARSFSSLIAQAASSTANAGAGGVQPPPPPGCTISTSPGTASASATGSSGAISVTVSASPCSWSATSSAAWLTVSPASGTATATVTWTAAANGTTSSRSATVMIAGHITTVTQAAGTSGAGGDTGGPVTGSSLNLQFDGASGGDFLTYNKGNGSWAVRLYDGSPFTTGATGAWMAGWQIFPAKFDAGNLTDLFFYNPTSGEWRKAINSGGGSFSIFFPPAGIGTGWIATVLDLNGDGISDVFLYNPTTGAWKRGISSPGATDFTYTTGTWATGWTVYKANFNNDGRDDLFLYKPSGAGAGQWARAVAQADGSFTLVAGDKTWGAGFAVYPGNYAGNGLTSVVLYRSSDGAATLVTFTATSATYVTSTWNTGWTVRTGDINGDGKTDLFFYNPSNGRWVVLTSSAGWFAFNSNGTSAGTGWDYRVYYLTGDAKADVLWYNPTTGATRVWITQGPTSYTSVSGPTIASGFTLVP